MVIVDTDIFQSAVRIRHGMDDIGGVDPQTVNKIVIERKKSEEGVWLKIREVNIITSDDIVFTLHDYTALSRQSYDYRSVCISEAGETQGVVVSITPITKGIVIADRSNAYVSLFNCKYTHQRVFPFAQITPYYSRYPHTIQNGEMNYESGTIEGLFNPLGIGCDIQMEYGDYEKKMIDFLSNGEPKMITTFDGRGWYANLKSPISCSSEAGSGLVGVKLEWTETGDVPADINILTAGW